MNKKPDDVLIIKELAAYLKIPQSTLYKLVGEGKVPLPEDRSTLAFPKRRH